MHLRMFGSERKHGSMNQTERRMMISLPSACIDDLRRLNCRSVIGRGGGCRGPSAPRSAASKWKWDFVRVVTFSVKMMTFAHRNGRGYGASSLEHGVRRTCAARNAPAGHVSTGIIGMVAFPSNDNNNKLALICL